jgi:hypothetical protein
MFLQFYRKKYEGLSRSSWTCLQDLECQVVQPSSARCHSIAIFSVSLLSFAAITLSIASLWCLLLCVLSSSHDFLMADLKQQPVCVKFCFELSKTALEMHEILKTAFVYSAMERTDFC